MLDKARPSSTRLPSWVMSSLCIALVAVALSSGFSQAASWKDVVWATTDGELVTARFDGSGFEFLLAENGVQFNWPSISPNNQRLAYLRQDAAGMHNCVLETSGSSSCVSSSSVHFGYGWTADSHKAYYPRFQRHGGGEIWRTDFGALNESVLVPGVYRTFGVTVNGDGSKIVMAHDPSNWTYNNRLVAYALDDSNPSPVGLGNVILGSDGFRDFFPDYSPTRDEFAWGRGTRPSCCGEPLDIWVMNDDGSGARPLTSNPEVNQYNPKFSPDGSQVFYLVDTPSGNDQTLWVIDREGLNARPILFLGPTTRGLPFDVAASFAECDAAPHSQGYWHRQCLGVPANSENPALGGIDPGRNGRGPHEPTEAQFTKDLMPVVTARLEDLLFEMGGSCGAGMDADPPSDKCEKALKQFTAMLFNLESDRLQNTCPVDLSAEGCSSTGIGSLVDELAGLINSGDADACSVAASCAAAVNEGTSLTESLVVQSVETEMPLNAELSGLDWRLSTGHGRSTSSDRDAEDVTGEVTTPLTPAVPMRIVMEPIAVEAQEGRDVTTVKNEEPVTLQRHLAVFVNPSAPEKARAASRDVLLTVLSGGYELEVRLAVAEVLVGQVDAAFHSLLVAHLEDIRREAAGFDKQDVAKRAERLLDRLSAGEAE